jgi:hypothetical protein
MLGVTSLAAGALSGGSFSPAAAPRITPPTRAAIRSYTSSAAVRDYESDAAIVVRTSDAKIGRTLG